MLLSEHVETPTYRIQINKLNHEVIKELTSPSQFYF